MAKKLVRNAAYYEDRLKREYPVIYNDLKAGKYSTVTDAAIAAGLKKPRTRLNELKNAWSKADVTEQREFLKWLRARMPPSRSVSVSMPAPITIDRRLVPTASARIQEIMLKRRLKMGETMAEMGFDRLNPSLGLAINQGTQLQPDVIGALEKWLVDNSKI